MVARISKFGKREDKLLGSVVAPAAFGAVLLAIVGFFVYKNVNMGQRRALLESRLQELQMQVKELSVQKEKLQANITDTQTEEYQEKILREQGLYKKEGEQVVTILPPEPAAEPAPLQEEEKRIWWQPWTW